MAYQCLDHSGRTTYKIVDTVNASRRRFFPKQFGNSSSSFLGKGLATGVADAGIVIGSLGTSGCAEVDDFWSLNSHTQELFQEEAEGIDDIFTNKSKSNLLHQRLLEEYIQTDINPESFQYPTKQELISDLVNYLRNNINIEGKEELADRILFLQGECLFEDEGQDILSYESMNNFVNFLRDNSGFKKPLLGVTYDGHIHAQWSGEGKTKFVVEFLPINQVRYVIFSQDPITPSLMERVSGTSSTKTVVEKARPYGLLNWILAYDVAA